MPIKERVGSCSRDLPPRPGPLLHPTDLPLTPVRKAPLEGPSTYENHGESRSSPWILSHFKPFLQAFEWLSDQFWVDHRRTGPSAWATAPAASPWASCWGPCWERR